MLVKEKKISTDYNVMKIREDFPILSQKVNKHTLVYFDNAATTQKPIQVINKLTEYYTEMNSNVHRGVHYLSEKATRAFEETREKARAFLNAENTRQIIFTKGTTDGINLVAASYGGMVLKPRDEVVISTMEHHSNIVPWQMICEKTGAVLKIIPISDSGEILLDEYEALLTDRTKIVSVGHISNSLGTINPIKEMIAIAHKRNIKVVIDGAQAGPHLPIDVQDLDADFYTVSSHKFYGPTGAGILYGKEDLLEAMPPYQGGGEMIKSVTFEKTIYNDLPFKFEAGTPNIADVIAMGATIDYLYDIRRNNVKEYEDELLQYGTDRLNEIGDIRFIGTAKNKASIISFLIKDFHPYDCGALLDQMGIAVRTGMHCTEPLMQRFKIPGTIRASFGLYNTKEEIDKMIEGIHKVKKMLS